MTQAFAVACYTLVELTRRRLLVVIVAIAVVLMAAIGIGPHLLPGPQTDLDRQIVMLTALGAEVPYAVMLCAFAVGMTVINHDLDSGAMVSILAKPVSRSSYTAGKVLAAISLLLVIAGIFTVGSLIVVAANGGGAYSIVLSACAALAANIVLLMLLVMVLTVYVNNVVAAAIVIAFHFVADNLLGLHAMIQNRVITDSVAKALINVVYWGVPHELASDLQRQIIQMRLDSGELVVQGFDPLKNLPRNSGTIDIVFWFAYVMLICALLFWSVRRKQV